MIYWKWTGERWPNFFYLHKVDEENNKLVSLLFSGKIVVSEIDQVTRDLFLKKIFTQNSDWKEISEKEYQIEFIRFQMERSD